MLTIGFSCKIHLRKVYSYHLRTQQLTIRKSRKSHDIGNRLSKLEAQIQF